MNKTQSNRSHKKFVAVAPMMDWTDRHCRYFMRLIAPHITLYTEMVTTGALIHGDRDRFLRFNEPEHPVILQLGGSEPASLAECAKMAQDYGYDGVNLNCGCPSDRVQSGKFGACLMSEPETVAKCVESMINSVNIPVSVKCRIAIDDEEELPFLNKFINTVSKAGCQEFTIHARKAWLKGLSPKENREIPPLRYDIATQIKNDYPYLHIGLNGGIQTAKETQKHLETFDSIMIGRAAYQNPYMLSGIEREIYENHDILERDEVAQAMIPYIEKQQKDYATPVKSVTRHMIGLYHQQPGAKQWRRYLSENAHLDKLSAKELIENAMPEAKYSKAA